MPRFWYLVILWCSLSSVAIIIVIRHHSASLPPSDPPLSAFTTPSLTTLRQIRDQNTSPSATSIDPRRTIYATLLCNTEFIAPVIALAASIKLAGSTRSLLVLVPDTSPLSEEGRADLLGVGCMVREVPLLPYPFKSSAKGLKIQKPCRYSKLRLWGMFEVPVYFSHASLSQSHSQQGIR